MNIELPKLNDTDIDSLLNEHFSKRTCFKSSNNLLSNSKQSIQQSESNRTKSFQTVPNMPTIGEAHNKDTNDNSKSKKQYLNGSVSRKKKSKHRFLKKNNENDSLVFTQQSNKLSSYNGDSFADALELTDRKKEPMFPYIKPPKQQEVNSSLLKRHLTFKSNYNKEKKEAKNKFQVLKASTMRSKFVNKKKASFKLDSYNQSEEIIDLSANIEKKQEHPKAILKKESLFHTKKIKTKKKKVNFKNTNQIITFNQSSRILTKEKKGGCGLFFCLF